MRRAAVALALVALAACEQGAVSIGPLELEVPGGWRVTNRQANNLQIANGTTAADTANEAGDATAVFDIYVDAPIGPDAYREQLLEENIGASSDEETIDGERAVILTYEGEATGGRQTAVFFPAHDVQIVYRAAFPNDVAAYTAGRGDFLRAVRSISFATDDAAAPSAAASS